MSNGASVDFVIYHRIDKKPLLAIEVDGFTYHENNAKQLQRDEIKNGIFADYGLSLLRLATNGSGEEQRIKAKLSEILNTNSALNRED